MSFGCAEWAGGSIHVHVQRFLVFDVGNVRRRWALSLHHLALHLRRMSPSVKVRTIRDCLLERTAERNAKKRFVLEEESKDTAPRNSIETATRRVTRRSRFATATTPYVSSVRH